MGEGEPAGWIEERLGVGHLERRQPGWPAKVDEHARRLDRPEARPAPDRRGRRWCGGGPRATRRAGASLRPSRSPRSRTARGAPRTATARRGGTAPRTGQRTARTWPRMIGARGAIGSIGGARSRARSRGSSARSPAGRTGAGSRSSARARAGRRTSARTRSTGSEAPGASRSRSAADTVTSWVVGAPGPPTVTRQVQPVLDGLAHDGDRGVAHVGLLGSGWHVGHQNVRRGRSAPWRSTRISVPQRGHGRPARR